jgi:sortase A
MSHVPACYLRRLEKLLLVIGITLLAVYGLSRLYSSAASHIALTRFRNGSLPVRTDTFRKRAREGEEKLDFSLWSEKRIVAYREALAMNFDAPVAVLSIPKLRLEVPVFDGTNELVLNRGAGRIKGTARPGERGNVGIAAHRDGFFRALKDIQLGDRIEMQSVNRKFTYIVDDIVIVSPYDVQVLRARLRPSLTLITCYPFYFVGDAPKRYIVHAHEAEEGGV